MELATARLNLRAAANGDASAGRIREPSESVHAFGGVAGSGGALTRLIRLHLSPAERIAAARLIANEDSRPLRSASDGGTEGALTLDAYAILTVVHDVARAQGWSHGRALRALGPHVAGNRAPTQRRHAVYRELPAAGAARPAGWDDTRDGPWSAYANNWSRLRAGVADAATNGFPAPCDGQLIAWGNAQDDTIALGRGLVRARCAGGEQLVNRFWRARVLAVSARDATGSERASR